MLSFVNYLTEKYAEGGFKYENEVADKLKKHGLMDPDTKTAGSSGDAPDAHIIVGGKQHSIEVKKDKSAMFGQLELHHKNGKWQVSERSISRYPATSSHPAVKAFLKKVNQQWGEPSGNYDTDLKMGNVYHEHPDASPIAAHYAKDRQTPYVQIGQGHGFYHFEQDHAKLNTDQLNGKTQLRARMKPRGWDKQGKRTYGALMVMSLKGDVNPSSKNLDAEPK